MPRLIIAAFWAEDDALAPVQELVKVIDQSGINIKGSGGVASYPDVDDDLRHVLRTLNQDEAANFNQDNE